MELFLSHATRDALVGEVQSRLEAVGVRVYTAERDGQAGRDVHDKIGHAIQRCDVVVVLLTQVGNDSRYVHQEVGYAKRSDKLIVPLVTSDVVKSGLGMLEGIEYIVADEADPSNALHTLSQRVEHLARQKRSQDDLMIAALVLLAVGVVIIAMSE